MWTKFSYPRIQAYRSTPPVSDRSVGPVGPVDSDNFKFNREPVATLPREVMVESVRRFPPVVDVRVQAQGRIRGGVLFDDGAAELGLGVEVRELRLLCRLRMGCRVRRFWVKED